jgi:hypothetical protein
MHCVQFNIITSFFNVLLLCSLEVFTTIDSSSLIHSRQMLQTPTMSPKDACVLFGLGFSDMLWDDVHSKPRTFANDEDCGEDGFNRLRDSQPGMSSSHETFKKICSFTGPANSTSCGETGYVGYMKNFVSPLIGLITDDCR